jgi:Alcohol dehydrogenase GroES-like domain
MLSNFIGSVSQVKCKATGKPNDVLAVTTEPIPVELLWGEVLVNIRAAPINPADLYTVATGGSYAGNHLSLPFIAGHDGVGVVIKVRRPYACFSQLPLPPMLAPFIVIMISLELFSEVLWSHDM